MAIARAVHPALSTPRLRRPVTGAVLILHGGKAHSEDGVRRSSLAAARMRPFAAAIGRRARGSGIAALLLRNRLQGWNGADADPVTDALWALERIRQRYGPVPVVLLGHSMGGRVALHTAGRPRIAGIVALAPWLPEGEPVAAPRGRSMLIVHGDEDRVTDPALSRSYARRAEAEGVDVEYRVIPHGDHAMLRSPGTWHGLAADFATRCLLAAPTESTDEPLSS